MLLVRKLKLHFGSILVAVLLVVGGASWQAWHSHQAQRDPTGSSWPGIVIGSVAAGIILFELLLWPRKWLRRFRLFPTKYWMVAHIWLGLATGPLAFIHSGYRFGGTFTTVLMGLLFFVLLSGIYGWVVQMVLPKWMLGNLPHETITGQIDAVSIQSALHARRMLTVAYGSKPEGLRKLANLDRYASEMSGEVTVQQGGYEVKAIVIGAVQRQVAKGSREGIEAGMEFQAEDGKELWRQYAAVIEPFMLRGIAFPNAEQPRIKSSQDKPISMSPVRTRQKMMDWFSVLRASCSLSAKPIVDRLEKWIEQRHQFDAQRRAQSWLHSWIAFHASVSVVLGILLVAHLVLALKYM